MNNKKIGAKPVNVAKTVKKTSFKEQPELMQPKQLTYEEEQLLKQISTPEMARLKALAPNKKVVICEDEIALQAVRDRVEETRSKKFSARSFAELIEFSHMGLPVEQYNIGIEME